MKFASLKSIYRKFFIVTQTGTPSRSDWWARERLSHLKRHGYLKSAKVSFSGTSYYLATDLAQMALTALAKVDGRSFVRPIETIDIRTFEHDRLVTDLRLILESENRARDWLSERRLKSEAALSFGLAREFQPDAIYRNKFGESVAFELEISVKSRERYQDKIRKYVDVMRENDGRDEGLKGVLFVTMHEGVFKILTEMTERHGGKFRIERLETLLSLDGSKEAVTVETLQNFTEGVS